MFVLGGWWSNDSLKRAQRLMRDGRYLQIDANLRYFYDRYERILAERDADPRWTDAVRGEEFRRDRKVYYDYIERARADVLEAVRRLSELESTRAAFNREAYEKWRAGEQ
jgi:hypothetical protein